MTGLGGCHKAPRLRYRGFPYNPFECGWGGADPTKGEALTRSVAFCNSCRGPVRGVSVKPGAVDESGGCCRRGVLQTLI